MKPLIHAKNSVNKWGGKVEDYLELHNFFDHSKACMPDMRHRALLHSSFGIFLLERVFGVWLVNSDGRSVSVRDVGEQHVIEDLGFIPTVEKWLGNMTIQPWMFGDRRGGVKTEHISFNED